MENTLIKIEEREDGRIAIHLNGDPEMLSNMLASAAKNEEVFELIFIKAMIKMAAYDEHNWREEIIRKTKLN
jgi:hypothetical protein